MIGELNKYRFFEINNKGHWSYLTILSKTPEEDSIKIKMQIEKHIKTKIQNN